MNMATQVFFINILRNTVVRASAPSRTVRTILLLVSDQAGVATCYVVKNDIKC